MDTKMFDPGIHLLVLCLIVISVIAVNGQYTCNYLDAIPDRPGWFSIEAMTCEYGCCGDLYDQRCCDKTEVDNKRWIISIAVIGGLLAVAIIAIIVLCVFKKKNAERAKIYTGDPPPPPANKSTESFSEITSPPPPYSPRDYNIFTTDNSAVSTVGQEGLGANNGHTNVQMQPGDLFLVQAQPSAPPTRNPL